MNRTILDRLFKLSGNGTNVRTELLAGVTTFLTMAYIIFVQPAVLSGKMFGIDTGMDFGAVTTATCLSGALATAVMAIYARYPIAQAPGMGENFFFVFSAIPAATAAGFANGWQVALGVVFVSGVLFLILSLVGLRELIFNSVSPSMKNGIAAGDRVVYCVHRIAAVRRYRQRSGLGGKIKRASGFAGLNCVLHRPDDNGGAARAPGPRLDSLGHPRRHGSDLPVQNRAAANALSDLCCAGSY